MRHVLLSSAALLGLTAGAAAADLSGRAAPELGAAAPAFTWTGVYVGANAGYGSLDRGRDGSCIGFSGFGDCSGGSGLLVPSAPDGVLVPVTPLTGFNASSLNGSSRRNDRDGFVGGGQIGYNYQFTPGNGWVLGVEADVQGVGFGRRRNTVLSNGASFFTAANVADFGATPGLGIADPTGTGNVALFNNAANGFDRSRIDWFATVRGRLGYAFDRFLIYGTGGVAFADRQDRPTPCVGCAASGAGIASG
jgi:outer membrane immunogenic protein